MYKYSLMSTYNMQCIILPTSSIIPNKTNHTTTEATVQSNRPKVSMQANEQASQTARRKRSGMLVQMISDHTGWEAASRGNTDMGRRQSLPKSCDSKQRG